MRTWTITKDSLHAKLMYTCRPGDKQNYDLPYEIRPLDLGPLYIYRESTFTKVTYNVHIPYSPHSSQIVQYELISSPFFLEFSIAFAAVLLPAY